jgi:hypothetical protein
MKIIFDLRSLNTVEKLTFYLYRFKDLLYRLAYLIHQHTDLSHSTINLQVPSTTKSPMLWLLIRRSKARKLSKLK